jgi:hypothetical protein
MAMATVTNDASIEATSRGFGGNEYSRIELFSVRTKAVLSVLELGIHLGSRERNVVWWPETRVHELVEFRS